jgi:hypothetical protein
MQLIAEPERPSYDEPFTLRLVDAPPGSSVALSARLIDLDGSVWRCDGDYAVDADGYVADPMRVIWSAEAGARGDPPVRGTTRCADQCVTFLLTPISKL